MRRLVLAALLIISLGLAVGSAAELDVDGGVLQVFRVEVDIDLPSSCEAPGGPQASDTSPGSDSPSATESNVPDTSRGNDCSEGESTTREGE